MRLLIFITNSFINAFGITRPKPEQQKTVALTLGGIFLAMIVALTALLAWAFFGITR